MQQLYVHKNGEQHGPYSEEEVQGWLSDGTLTHEDTAWTDDVTGWRPLGEICPPAVPQPSMIPMPQMKVKSVTGILAAQHEGLKNAVVNLLDDDQDSAAVEKILKRAKELLTEGEYIDYVGVQKKPIVTISPDAVLLTNKRVMIVRPKLLGMTFDDRHWRDVANVHMSEQMLGATIKFLIVGGKQLQLDSLPKKQARKIYTYAQQMEERMHEERRQRDLESKRAGAGGVVLNAPMMQPPLLPTSQPAMEDPMQTLGKLKQLLDAGLIEPSEYNQKKAEVLQRM